MIKIRRSWCVYSQKEMKDMTQEDFKKAFENNEELQRIYRLYLEEILSA